MPAVGQVSVGQPEMHQKLDANQRSGRKGQVKRQAPPRKWCTGRGNCGAAAKSETATRDLKQRQVLYRPVPCNAVPCSPEKARSDRRIPAAPGGVQWVCPVAVDWPLGPVINQVRPNYGGRVLDCTTAGRDVKCAGRTERTYTDGKRELP